MGRSLGRACSTASVVQRRVGVFSSPSGWYVGCADGDHLALIALGGATVDVTPPGVRRHCGHEVAFAVLCGLQYSL
jgi:hypothetical protein